MKIFLILMLFSQYVLAQELKTAEPFPSEGAPAVPEIVHEEKSPVVQVIEEAKSLPEAKNKSEPKLKTKDLRALSTGTVMIGYQPLTTWLPHKKVLSYTHIFNPKWSLEFEYSWTTIDFPIYGVDLGAINEKKYTLQARRYVGNSFNFTFGPVLSDFSARLGGDMLDRYGAEIKSRFEVQNVGLSGGLGNRWQWSNGVTFGVDWFRMNIPLFETKVKDSVLSDISKAGDQSDVKSVIRTLNRIPTFVLFGLQLGYTF